jgi:hypothetical protein
VLRETSHPEQALLQFLEIPFKMAFHVVSVPFDPIAVNRARGSSLKA